MDKFTVTYYIYRIPVRKGSRKELRSRIRKIKDREPVERLLFLWLESSQSFAPNDKLKYIYEPFPFGGKVICKVTTMCATFTGESVCSLGDLFDLKHGKDRALANAFRSYYVMSESTY